MRKEILDALIAKQEDIISKLQTSIETYETTTDLDEEMTRDLDSFSQQAETQDIQLELMDKLALNKNILAKSKKLYHYAPETLSEGSIAETKDTIYVFGVAVPPFKFNDKTVVGVSTEAPAFLANTGKSKSDKLVLGENEHDFVNLI